MDEAVAPEPGPSAPAPSPSAAPVRQPGTRSRAGNAMPRTREAVLAAALTAVQRHGVRRTTMADIAGAAGVAKATLYNHFRTKDDVLAALVADQIERLGAECAKRAAEGGLADALGLAAERLGTHPALRRVAADEPAVLLPLLAPGEHGRHVADAAVSAVLEASGVAAAPAAVAVLGRWLASALLQPIEPAALPDQAALVAAVVAGAGPALPEG